MKRKYGFVLALGLILLVLGVILFRPRGQTSGLAGLETTAVPLVPSPSADTSAPVITEPARPAPVPIAEGTVRVNKKPPPTPVRSRPAPVPGPVTLAGKVDSWEDWNSSFSDTVTRTYSAIFDSSRLDTTSGDRIEFSATGRSGDFVPVKRVFCTVDSVKPLLKYTFPGVSVDFVIGVGFASGVSFKGELKPQAGTFNLELDPTADERIKEEGNIALNQFVVALTSPPGYRYTVRTGIECYFGGESSGRTRIYYTSPARVEFRRMVRYQSLLGESADTLFILTTNPAAITDLAKAVPRSWISAVFVPVHDPSESENLLKLVVPNLRIHVSVPRPVEKSFVIFNDSVGLVEKNIIDPEFKRTAQLKLKGVQLNRIGLPRVTNLVRGESAVEELKLLFMHYNRLTPQ
jgi:hypothetical protein